MKMQFSKTLGGMAILASTLVLTGCPSDSKDSDNKPTEPPKVKQEYKVTVTNLTANQPFSPVTVVAHQANYPQFVAGQPASNALERLAEAGNNSGFSSEKGVDKVESGSGELFPGNKAAVSISLDADKLSRISVLAMPVNTNDAFVGLSNVNLANLAVGQTVSFRGNIYDAGTEANTETKSTVPGPAGGGQGYNPERDDINKVHIHPGVISADDGLTGSTLSASHRFDNPGMSVVIERVK
ncbi:spondin domain-containing protein [Parashewanella tropica]|uniref:spondin domain-containing protein n=1 Tax=Parashewanella tropica TaxID=2547970 RepID=UPI001C55302D|nr:spondin domain-containing protein [Parashewanella tropica]